MIGFALVVFSHLGRLLGLHDIETGIGHHHLGLTLVLHGNEIGIDHLHQDIIISLHDGDRMTSMTVTVESHLTSRGWERGGQKYDELDPHQQNRDWEQRENQNRTDRKRTVQFQDQGNC